MTNSEDFFDIGPARGGKRPGRELSFVIVRGLTPDDMHELETPSPLGSQPIPIQQLRASHHQLAQLLAQGRPDTEVSLITGYSQSRISILKKDPTFQELLAGYKDIRERTFADTLERMKVLGLSSLDELQERLEASPERWTNRELMEMADLMLVKPQQKLSQLAGNAVTGQSPVSINVQFVESKTPKLTIDHEVPLALPTGSKDKVA